MEERISTSISTEPEPEAQATEQPVAEAEEKTYRYQALDERGQPIGRETVIKYKTPDELQEGINKAANAILAARRVPDPQPEQREPTVQDLKAELDTLKLQRAQGQFLSNHPEYANTDANGALIWDYLEKRGLPKTLTNMEIAYANLSLTGALIQRPAQVETPPAAPNPPAARPAASPASGIKPGTITNRPVPPKALTLADINAMSTDEYKRRAHDPAFVAMVNRLGEEARRKRRA